VDLTTTCHRVGQMRMQLAWSGLVLQIEDQCGRRGGEIQRQRELGGQRPPCLYTVLGCSRAVMAT